MIAIVEVVLMAALANQPIPGIIFTPSLTAVATLFAPKEPKFVSTADVMLLPAFSLILIPKILLRS
jgi:hypothetical protein